MFAVAAVLWFVYLIPTWLRRKEYLATERNATRIQQTLRIMAETAEVPEEVRLEANARGAAQAERLLREQERQRVERERAALARVRASEHPDVVRAVEARRRVRRSRALTAAVLFVAVGAVVAQLVLMASSGVVVGSWVVIGVAAVVGIVAFAQLRRLANRRIPAPIVQVGVPAAAQRRRDLDEPAVAQRREAGWTPVPVPRPRYLDQPAPQRAAPSIDAERRMREAALAAERALRAAHAEPEVVAMPVRRVEPAAPAAAPVASAAPAAPAAEPSRWARMGILDDVPTTTPDLDEVLRRRRAAG